MASPGSRSTSKRANPQGSSSNGIQLTVTPAQSAFFSGEALVYHVTFTNTRPPRRRYSTQHTTNGQDSPSTRRHPSSAPPSKSSFVPGNITPSSAKTFVDLTNSKASSTHIVVPERKGVIGTPLSLSRPISRASSPSKPSALSTPPLHTPPPETLGNLRPPNGRPGHLLYPSKRQAAAGHKKGDYSVALSSSPYADELGERDAEVDDPESIGVSDLSSQLAGIALLQERGSAVADPNEVLLEEETSFAVDQYKKHGNDLIHQQQGHVATSNGRRVLSSFSSIAEESPEPAAGSSSNVKQFSPSRSYSVNSLPSPVSNDMTAGSRVFSSSSSATAFDAADASNGHTPHLGSDFYGQGRNDSVDSVLRDSMTSYAAARPSHSASASVSRERPYLPSLRPAQAHGRSYSAASSPAVGSSPLRPFPRASPHIEEPEDSGTETLLWAFAQFSGSFTVDDSLVKSTEFVAVKRALFGSKQAPGTGMPGSSAFVGGGSLDGSAIAGSGGIGGNSSWKEWIWGSSASTSSSGQNGRTSVSGGPSSTLSLPTDPVVDPSARRRSSGATMAHSNQGRNGTSPSSGVGSLEERRNRAMNDQAVPVFSSPPSILAVDLSLEPGESKTYTFTLKLPGDLPPSFKGKAISFTYTFLVGTNRAPHHASGEFRQQSRLVRVPVRIYNHVSVTGVRPFYDLTNPIVWYRDEAKVTTSDEDNLLEASQAVQPLASISAPPTSAPTALPPASTKKRRDRATSIETAMATARKGEQKKDFEAYAAQLLGSTFFSPIASPMEFSPISETKGAPSSLLSVVEPAASRAQSLPVPQLEPSPTMYNDGGPAARPELMTRSSSNSGSPLMRAGSLMGVPSAAAGTGGGANDEEDTSCKAAVEIVSRNAQKVSYDINKDGYRIATVTLVKSAYRLGDTVNVMVTVNAGDAKTLRLAARLETHELIETTVSVKSSTAARQATRRLHAEHHETTLDSGRVGFALAIPSGASPDFSTSGVKLQWSLRLSFLILPPRTEDTGGTGLPGPMQRTPSHSRNASTAFRSPQQRSGTNSNALSPSTPRKGHGKSLSFAAFGGNSSPSTPVPVISTGQAHHLLPVPPAYAEQQYTSYRAIPDLSFVPTLFSTPEALAAQDNLAGLTSSPALGSAEDDKRPQHGRTRSGAGIASMEEKVVLMPSKIETVEINIPLRVYPSATPFRAPIATFNV